MFWACHKDTDNLHLDVVVNRINPETFFAAPMHFKIKTNERAARKIEIEQGWRIEPTGKFYKVIQLENGSFEIVEKAKSREKSISKKARDSENRTGLASGETIAKNVAAPILYNAKSWQDAHEKLAEVGIRLEKIGSGGVLVVGDQHVKLSAGGKQCSFKNLVKRFGEFIPRNFDIEVKEIAPQSMVKGDFWEASILEREQQRRDFYTEKMKARKELNQEIFDLKQDFYQSKKSRRAALKAERQSWKGHGSELNAKRSMLAAQFAVEEAHMRKLIAEKRKKFQAYWRSFKNYEDWLREQENERAAEIWRYRRAWNEGVIFGDVFIFSPHADLSIFNVEVVDGGSVEYRNKNTDELAILDRGRRIEVTAWHDEDTLMFALLIAAEKWPRGINLVGNEEFIERCIEICARENIKLKDPDLQAKVDELRENWTQDKLKRQERDFGR